MIHMKVWVKDQENIVLNTHHTHEKKDVNELCVIENVES